MKLRQAVAAESDMVAPLIISSGPEMYQFLYQTSGHPTQDFIKYEFESGIGFCGYKNVSVIEENGKPIASGCFFTRYDFNRLALGSLLNLFRFYPMGQILPAIRRSLQATSILKTPGPGEVYLSNFGVAEDYRGRGVGQNLIYKVCQSYQSLGAKKFGLDVAVNNPNAQRLYQRLGLTVIQEKKFSATNVHHQVPDCRKMECDLQDLLSQ